MSCTSLLTSFDSPLPALKGSLRSTKDEKRRGGGRSTASIGFVRRSRAWMRSADSRAGRRILRCQGNGREDEHQSVTELDRKVHRRKGFTHSFSARASLSNALLSLGLTKVQQINQARSVRNSEVDKGRSRKRGWKGYAPPLGLLDPLLNRLGARHLSPSSTRDLAQREEQSLDPKKTTSVSG